MRRTRLRLSPPARAAEAKDYRGGPPAAIATRQPGPAYRFWGRCPGAVRRSQSLLHGGLVPHGVQALPHCAQRGSKSPRPNYVRPPMGCISISTISSMQYSIV